MDIKLFQCQKENNQTGKACANKIVPDHLFEVYTFSCIIDYYGGSFVQDIEWEIHF